MTGAKNVGLELRKIISSTAHLLKGKFTMRVYEIVLRLRRWTGNKRDQRI